jgi:hypothetical protein
MNANANTNGSKTMTGNISPATKIARLTRQIRALEARQDAHRRCGEYREADDLDTDLGFLQNDIDDIMEDLASSPRR